MTPGMAPIRKTKKIFFERMLLERNLSDSEQFLKEIVFSQDHSEEILRVSVGQRAAKLWSLKL